MKLRIKPEESIYKYLFYLILTVLGAYNLLAIYTSTRQMYWDFPNYYVSSNLLQQGESVSQFYNNTWFEAKAIEMGIEHPARFNPFPPITSVLMLPLSGFEPLMAKRIWILINLFLLIIAVKLTSKLFLFDYKLSAFFLLLTGASLALNFRLGQYYLLIFVLLLLVYQAYQKGHLRSSALLLSAITIIKYFPIVFIVGFLKRNYLLFFGIGVIVLILAQWILFGTETIQAYVTVLQNHLNGSIDGQGQHIIAFQSYSSLFANIFIEIPGSTTPPVFDWFLGKSIMTLAVILVIFGSALFTIKKVYQRDNASDLIMIIVGMATLTVLPASAAYHYVLLLFPFLLLMKWQLTRGYTKQNLILTFLFASVTNILLIPFPKTGSYLVDLILDYPRLWSMTILYFYSIRVILQLHGEAIFPITKKSSYEHLFGKQL